MTKSRSDIGIFLEWSGRDWIRTSDPYDVNVVL